MDSEIRAIVFDMDGVLIDSHPVHRAAWREFLRSLSVDVSEPDLAFILEGGTRTDILRHFLGDLPQAELMEYGRRKDEIFRSLEHEIRPAPGVLAFLRELERAGLVRAVATSASEISQRYNVIVYSIYGVGVGRAGRSAWDLQLALGGLTKIADETGGECFSLSTTQLVSFKPYLDRLANYLQNQYFLEFAGIPKGKGNLQRVRLDAEIKNSELLAPDNVWVAPPEAAKE